VTKEVSNSGKDGFKRAETALFFMLRVKEPDRKTGTEWTAKVLAG